MADNIYFPEHFTHIKIVKNDYSYISSIKKYYNINCTNLQTLYLRGQINYILYNMFKNINELFIKIQGSRDVKFDINKIKNNNVKKIYLNVNTQNTFLLKQQLSLIELNLLESNFDASFLSKIVNSTKISINKYKSTTNHYLTLYLIHKYAVNYNNQRIIGKYNLAFNRNTSKIYKATSSLA